MPCVTGRNFETAFQNKLFRFSIQLVLPTKITYFADRNNLFSWAIQLVLQAWFFAFSSFHFQYRERVALAVRLVALEYLEAHSFVKHPGGGILLVYVYEFNAQFVKRPSRELFAQSLAEIAGMEKEHLNLPLLHAHEPDGALAVLHYP